MVGQRVAPADTYIRGHFIAFYSALITGATEGEARTVAMSSIVMMEIIYIFSSRSITKSALGKGFFSNKWIFVGVGLTLLFQLGVIYLPMMNSLFKTEAISMIGWVPILAAAGALFVFVELEKMGTDKERCEKELFEIAERLGLDRFERRSYLELKLGG